MSGRKLVPPAPHPVAVGGHRYNDDLLLDDESRRYAQMEFPLVFDVLDDPELREAFRSIDEAANLAKRRSQRSGFWAVILAVVSLMAASGEPVWEHLRFGHMVRFVITSTAGLLGLFAAFLAAFGILHGKQKDQWLHHRYCTERLRQFHFQSFVWKLAHLAQHAADPHRVRRFVEDRRKAIKSFVYELEGKAAAGLSAVLKPTGGSEFWVCADQQLPATIPTGHEVDELFRAYRKLRFDEQLGYAEHQLRTVSSFPKLSHMPLLNQRRTLRRMWFLAFSALILLHVFIVGDQFINVGHELATGGLDKVEVPPWLHVFVVWAAIIALGARTLEEGFQLSREIERYEDYQAEVSDARMRFDHASTDEAKVHAMIDMERISFEEMRRFLRTANEASFVL